MFFATLVKMITLPLLHWSEMKWMASSGFVYDHVCVVCCVFVCERRNTNHPGDACAVSIPSAEEEISNMRKELDKYGIHMPAFSKIGGILANELSVDEAAREYNAPLQKAATLVLVEQVFPWSYHH